jgi:hypothetical protein
MIGRTAQRLRDTAAAIGDSVRPQDIPALNLDRARRQFADQERCSARWRGGRWLVPIVAAGSVATVVTGVALASQVLHAGFGRTRQPTTGARPGPVTLPPGTPRFMVTSLGAQGSVRLVATGRLIAKIPPPVSGFQIEGIAALPGDRVFYLAGETFVGRQSPNGAVEFFRIVLRGDGRPSRAIRVPGPTVSLHEPTTSNGLISIPVAVSPDGNYLAYAISRQFLGDAASRPATITIVRIATGASRTWKVWPAGRTQISELSWAQGGQLSWVGVIGDATVANGSVVRHRGDELSVVMVLGTAVPGRSLVTDSRLVTYGWLSESATGPSAVLDGPVAGVITSDGETVAAQILTDHGKRSRLVTMSAANGQIIRVLIDGPTSFQANPASIGGDSLLFTLSPRHEHPRPSYVCGHLALDKLSTGKIVQLPFEIYCSTLWPGPVVIYAW